MRDRTHWRAGLVKAIRQVWPPGDDGMAIGAMADIELGMYLVDTVCPKEPVAAGYELLSGYPWLAGLGAEVTEEDLYRIEVARHLLAPLRSRRDWTTALERYQDVPENVRGYTIGADGRATARDPSVAPDRFDLFARALSEPPPHRRFSWRPGGPGAYSVTLGGGVPTSVTVPKSLVPDAGPRGHDTTARTDREPFTVTWAELADTATWLDEREAVELPVDERGNWAFRFGRLRLRCRSGEDFVDSERLTIADVTHLIGMVGSGKSTLMLLTAVLAARRNRHVTVVVGDVLSALRHVTWMTSVGVPAAPVVGATTQLGHIKRLHQVHASQTRTGSPLVGYGPEHDLLSTACALDALRPTSKPWAFGDAPCEELTRARDGDDSAPASEHFGCPLWSDCQRHRASRDLVDAMVWVATPAGLVNSRVPPALNREQVRYLELVWRRSDLVIVDEADQVQTQLDSMFSPSQTLIGRDHEAWLESLMDHTERELRGSGRAQFADRLVREWSARVDTARSTANRLYALLSRDPLPRGRSTLQKWIGRDCFNEWSLADKVVRDWSGVDAPEPGDPRYERLRHAFDIFLLDPLGARGRADDDPFASALVELTRALINLADEDERTARVVAWLTDLDSQFSSPGTTDQGQTERALQVEFTVQLAVLSNTLNTLIRGWRAVEGSLNLDRARGLMFQRPPEDYTSVVPSPPMGSVLGYQYQEDPGHDGAMGRLRFFRCTGVGRWALLNLHRLFGIDSPTGPAVLLMSGTSWAGNSPRYDLQVPVTAILRAPDDELAGIDASEFYLSTVHDERGLPVSVSGRYGDARHLALRTILRRLSARPHPDLPSQFEAELVALPEDRRRILLVVGNYDEAREVANELVEARGDWRDRVLHLVPDYTEFTGYWEQALRRGDLSRLASTGATFLVAPLLAIERGHNILNEYDRAAIGSVYFLVRPHPRPDDITYPVQSMNRWAVETHTALATGRHRYPTDDLLTLARAARRDGYTRWRRMLTTPLVYGSLDVVHERPALAWTQMVTLWQVVGRLVRGGCAARVHFCDAKFTPDPTDPDSSLLFGMRKALAEFLGPDANPSPADRELAESLYGPLYRGLTRLFGDT